MIRRLAHVSRNRSRGLRLALLAVLAGGLAARAARALEAAAPAGPAAAVAPGGPAAPAAPAATPADALAKRLTELRHKVLRDDDFVEDEDSNRDPFHSYLRAFADHVAPLESKKIPSAFEKVGIEDLALIAVVTGGDAPRAMFRDPSGFGQTVRRGDFLSRSGARITKILSDRVILEITETPGSGEARVVEKAILVNPEEAP